MVKERACLKCKTIFEGDKCTNCGDSTVTEGFKGEAVIFAPEKSLIAHHLKIASKGRFALKVK